MQIIEKTRIKQRFAVIPALRTEICNFCFGKLECAEEIDGSCQAAGDGEFSTERVLPKRDMERRLVIAHTSLPITTCHRDLIKVGRQGDETVSRRFPHSTRNLNTQCGFANDWVAHASRDRGTFLLHQFTTNRPYRKIVSAPRRNQHARRVRYPDGHSRIAFRSLLESNEIETIRTELSLSANQPART